MKRWKKFFALLLCVLLVLGLAAGCGRTGTESETASEEISLTVRDNDAGGGEAPQTENPPEEEEIQDTGPEEQAQAAPETDNSAIDRNGSYTSKEDVALYLHTYGELPSNFITKNEARAAGWEGGALEHYCPGKCIGGDRFGNREGLLPKAKGRTWTECDINTLGARSRGAERIVFSNDGLIYYTGDHYESFQLLYGKP